MITLEPDKGAIRAMVGGYDFTRSEYNRAVQAHRQPGSAFKPIIYATAVSQGMSPASVILDAPVVYEQDQDEKTWKPENYGRKIHGMVSLRDALAHSHNLATVRLLDKVGVKDVIEFAKTVGITSPLAADLSLGLGSSSLGLMELTSAYGVLLNQGSRAEPYAILSVKDNAGTVLEQAVPQAIPVISKETAYLITNMMEDVIQKGTGQAAKVLGRPIAGKTGTTDDFINAWFIGGAPNLVTGIYVGFDDRRSLGETESGRMPRCLFGSISCKSRSSRSRSWPLPFRKVSRSSRSIRQRDCLRARRDRRVPSNSLPRAASRPKRLSAGWTRSIFISWIKSPRGRCRGLPEAGPVCLVHLVCSVCLLG